MLAVLPLKPDDIAGLFAENQQKFTDAVRAGEKVVVTGSRW